MRSAVSPYRWSINSVVSDEKTLVDTVLEYGWLVGWSPYYTAVVVTYKRDF